MTFRYSPQAEIDIHEIASYIAQDNYGAALNWIDQIDRKCELISSMPKMGSKAEIRPEMRTFPFGNYLILYREINLGIEVLRVVSSVRDWQKLLS